MVSRCFITLITFPVALKGRHHLCLQTSIFNSVLFQIPFRPFGICNRWYPVLWKSIFRDSLRLGESAISVDGTLKVIECREQQKKLSVLQMELKKAKKEGFVSNHLIETEGTNENSKHGDNLDRDIDNEIKKTNDFLILNDHVEELKEQPRKTKLFYVDALQEWDAEFYVKVNDDILVCALGAILSTHVNKPRAYIGSMKSGGVFSKPKH
ncbi:hypothetical protein L2E82_35983 [Cichorium intybus]|uniref:Uncharacterized protein n=1 Tax=Cichorium intybus TaxID=13427 RepID=A0ACB9BQ93_CICIN|nr:hypothetical protein L2E82_35983 [Cichorium intybus]